MTDYFQLSDLAFQRHILVQALILIDFLLALTDKAKSKPLYQNAQKAMQYSFTLREEDVSFPPIATSPPGCSIQLALEAMIINDSADHKAQTEWALGTKNAIANYLQEGPDGKFYYRMVDTVLSRDKNWVRWKMENCQPFTRDRVPTKDFVQAKSGAQRAVQNKKPSKPMGVSSNLNFLYNNEAEKGLVQLRQADRYVLRSTDGPMQKLTFVRFNVPDAESYANKVRMADLDLEMADTEDEKRQVGAKKSSYVWKGLRLASKKQLSSFDRIEHGKGLEALQPVTSSIETTGDGTAPIAPDDRGEDPQKEHHSVEEQRADQHSQVTSDSAP